MWSLTGENHSTYTVILRACGNEATTWWDGRWAWLAAIYMVFIASCAPGGEMHVEHCYLVTVCWSIYMYICITGSWWKQLETFNVYVYIQYNVRVYPKILEGLLFITRNKMFDPWYTYIWKYLKNCLLNLSQLRFLVLSMEKQRPRTD